MLTAVCLLFCLAFPCSVTLSKFFPLYWNQSLLFSLFTAFSYIKYYCKLSCFSVFVCNLGPSLWLALVYVTTFNADKSLTDSAEMFTDKEMTKFCSRYVPSYCLTSILTLWCEPGSLQQAIKYIVRLNKVNDFWDLSSLWNTGPHLLTVHTHKSMFKPCVWTFDTQIWFIKMFSYLNLVILYEISNFLRPCVWTNDEGPAVLKNVTTHPFNWLPSILKRRSFKKGSNHACCQITLYPVQCFSCPMDKGIENAPH